jgi:hypothetical protein
MDTSINSDEHTPILKGYPDQRRILCEQIFTGATETIRYAANRSYVNFSLGQALLHMWKGGEFRATGMRCYIPTPSSGYSYPIKEVVRELNSIADSRGEYPYRFECKGDGDIMMLPKTVSLRMSIIRQ